MYMTGNDIREQFLRFFESKGCLRVPSASLIPKDDPTILLTAAGMVPFKPFYSGKVTPPKSRVTSCQKCVRVNDIENVGRTPRHHSFFEMLGNFSFGDYFKREAITWAWEFINDYLHMDTNRIWVSVHLDDDEAHGIWTKEVGFPAERVVRLGSDNFWDIGAGACGPCSEIFWDQGREAGCGAEHCTPECDCGRYLEFWNLVFPQFNHVGDEYLPLEKKGIDTGMGMERISSIMQGVKSNFETDLIRPLVDYAGDLLGTKYGIDDATDTALRVIADHGRSMTFLITDGVLPSNEGRGYVLRRLLRRAARFGKLHGTAEPFLYRMVGKVIDMMGAIYPELVAKQEYIVRMVRLEEERFLETLEQGMNLLASRMTDIKAEGKTTIPGDAAFRLYDTYGFPLELTVEIASEQGFSVDQEGFSVAMQRQRETARSARQETEFKIGGLALLEQLPKEPSQFVGYDQFASEADLLAVIVGEHVVEDVPLIEEVSLVLSCTPFYAESGGQVGDRGDIEGPGGTLFHVEETHKLGHLTLHRGHLVQGGLHIGAHVRAKIDEEFRQAIRRNHTTTHLLHKALHDVLGSHAQQAGSLVSPDRLRFDFSHFTAFSAEELADIEQRVNVAILAAHPVTTDVTTLEAARQANVTALFGEKYGDRVRVVKVEGVSSELCGGTHVRNTGEIGLARIVSEAGIGSGLRRIEMVTGYGSRDLLLHMDETLHRLAGMLKAPVDELERRLEAVLNVVREKDREIESLQGKLSQYAVTELLDAIQVVEGVPVVAAQVQAPDMDTLRSMTDILKGKVPSGVFVLGAVAGDRVNFVAVVTPDLISRGLHAGKLVGEIAKLAGGGGGGRPEMAQAGGKNPAAVLVAIQAAPEIVAGQIKK